MDKTNKFEINDLNLFYGQFQALRNINLEIKEHEITALIGPSGCGKSTTLRMIAGLEEITNGKLYIDKVLANTKSPDQRDIAMVFQSYALYPHMNVYDNMKLMPKGFSSFDIYKGSKLSRTSKSRRSSWLILGP